MRSSTLKLLPKNGLVLSLHRGNLASVAQKQRLEHGEVVVRKLSRLDYPALDYLLHSDREWLEPWEATTPGIRTALDVRWLIGALLKQHRKGETLAFVIVYQDQVVGQLNVSNILFGSICSGTIGYWIAKEFAGLGITPKAVALVLDYLLGEYGLHRVEIDIKPENQASLRVVQKLKLRHEGTKLRYININGKWSDHEVFAITKEELKGSMLDRL
ncbi:MAG: N-acetyltransferase [Actinobacteria bacterium]|nr:N-acetyltransferase [Actinomycetota bacterium]